MQRGSVDLVSEVEARMGLEVEGDSGSRGLGRDSREVLAGVVAAVWADGFEDLGWPQLGPAMASHRRVSLCSRASCVADGCVLQVPRSCDATASDYMHAGQTGSPAF